MNKDKAKNRIDSRWVLKWKIIDKTREVKARLCVRGFKDREAMELETFAGTATRWGQRMVYSIAAQHGWMLWSMDISMAFLRGLTFTEISERTGAKQRNLQFDLPKGANVLLREFPGFEDFNDYIETLDQTKPGFGTKDAPWAWSLELVDALVTFGFVATRADPRFFVLFRNAALHAVISTHVDDVKGASTDEVRKEFLKYLEERYGKVAFQEKSFECVGIKHKQYDDFSVEMDQDHYCKQMRQIDLTAVKYEDVDFLLPQHLIQLYMSLLGGIAWLTLTRAEVCVFVNKLQRKAKNPSLGDAKDANKLLRWIQRKSAKTLYKKMLPPVAIVIFSDSAYRADDEDCLALRAAIATLMEVRDGVPGGTMHVLDFYTRKQARVNRSTFGAELNAMMEAIDIGLLLCCFLTEVTQGIKPSIEMVHQLESGSLPIDLRLIGDAHGVYSALTAREIATPLERPLLYGVRAIRDYLEAKKVTRIHRLDTRDMLCDALTKGGINRDAILNSFAKGSWTIGVPEQHHGWSA
jgi:hypothetical protein